MPCKCEMPLNAAHLDARITCDPSFLCPFLDGIKFILAFYAYCNGHKAFGQPGPARYESQTRIRER
jgi:hypothetical protein